MTSPVTEEFTEFLEAQKRRVAGQPAPRKKVVIGQRTCTCGVAFDVFNTFPQKKFCSKLCAHRFRKPEDLKQMHEKSVETKRIESEDRFARLPKSKVFALGRAAGYQKARTRYNLRIFLQKLLILLTDQPA